MAFTMRKRYLVNLSLEPVAYSEKAPINRGREERIVTNLYTRGSK
jgi:hypothetical protein